MMAKNNHVSLRRSSSHWSRLVRGGVIRFGFYFLLCALSFVFLYPFIKMITQSLMTDDDLINITVKWLPSKLTPKDSAAFRFCCCALCLRCRTFKFRCFPCVFVCNAIILRFTAFRFGFCAIGFGCGSVVFGGNAQGFILLTRGFVRFAGRFCPRPSGFGCFSAVFCIHPGGF